MTEKIFTKVKHSEGNRKDIKASRHLAFTLGKILVFKGNNFRQKEKGTW